MEVVIKKGRKRGRPRSTTKTEHRTHSIVLSEKAELVYRAMCHSREGSQKWFHKHVSETLIELGTTGLEKKVCIKKILHHRQAELHKQQKDVADELKEIGLKLKQLNGGDQ